MPQLATFISHRDFHYIDHLAPLSSLLDIPLIVSSEEVETLVNNFYPEVKVFQVPPLELLSFFNSRFDIIFTCLPTPMFKAITFSLETSDKNNLLNIWCPHGNSDKGHHTLFMEGLNQEKVALVYGQKMIDFLSAKGSYNQLESVITVGNYRYKHYSKHKAALDAHFQSLFSFNSNPIIFYAPTWKDSENNSSFDHVFERLVDDLPDHFNLIVKLHPNTFSSPELLEIFSFRYSQKKNLLILPEFPPIYPILNGVDIYLGDMSSIGYDFLTFRKPMFFLNIQKRNPKTDPSLQLAQCGTVINPQDFNKIYSIIENCSPIGFTKEQDALYDAVFGAEDPIKENVLQYYEQTQAIS